MSRTLIRPEMTHVRESIMILVRGRLEGTREGRANLILDQFVVEHAREGRRMESPWRLTFVRNSRVERPAEAVVANGGGAMMSLSLLLHILEASHALHRRRPRQLPRGGSAAGVHGRAVPLLMVPTRGVTEAHLLLLVAMCCCCMILAVQAAEEGRLRCRVVIAASE